MPSRRPHTNSHHGCLQCKAKRVKCDQTQPRCARCQKRGSDCTYRHLMSSYNPFQGSPPGQTGIVPATSPSSAAGAAAFARRLARPRRSIMVGTTRLGSIAQDSADVLSQQVIQAPYVSAAAPMSITPPTPPPVHSPLHLDHNDNFLLHHFTQNLTSATMGPILESELSPAMTSAILRYLPVHSYLLQVVLCFSSMHLASVQPSTGDGAQDHLAIALKHKAKALESFRPAIVSGVDQDNGEALLASSTVLVACALALPIADPSRRTKFDRIEILAQTAGLFQGTWALFKHGIYGPYAGETTNTPRTTGTWSPGDGVPWTDAYRSMCQVMDIIEALPEITETERHRKRILGHAGAKLRKAATLVATAKKNFHVICMWLGMVKQDFIDLMYAKDNLALILVAHWAVCRSKSYSVWWVKGWPTAAVNDIKEMVDDEYEYLLEWCVAYANVAETYAEAEEDSRRWFTRRTSSLSDLQTPANTLFPPTTKAH